MRKMITIVAVIMLGACGPSKEEIERMEKLKQDSITAGITAGTIQPPTPEPQVGGTLIEGIIVNGCTYYHDPRCANHK